MSAMNKLLPDEKKEIVFTTGGTRAAKIIGIIVFLVGLGILGTALARLGDMAGNPAPGYLMGGLWVAAGVGIFSYRSEKRFDPARQRWLVSKTFWWLGSKQEGDFSDLSEVEVDCHYSGTDATDYSGPCTYDVKVTVIDGNDISIRKDIRHAHHAFSIAYDLCGKLSLPLENKAAGKDNIIEMVPPDNAPEPPGRLSTGTFDGDTVTFIIPRGTRLGKKYRVSMVLTVAFVAAPLLGVLVFAAFIFWDWFAGWLRTGKIKELWNALMAVPFILLPAIAVYAMFTRVFMAREKLQAGPSGITYRRLYGHWRREKRIARSRITAVKTRLNKFGSTRRIEDIMILAEPDTILFGHGLPDEEKTWIASQLCRILNLQQSHER
jgi:hypothetical protein